MAKFYGKVGYGEQVETKPGVWENVITERSYYGDIVRNTRNSQDTQFVNDDITVNNSISVVADAYAHNHIFAMKYIVWAGVYWTVQSVDVQAPRLILRLGGMYNGPRP